MDGWMDGMSSDRQTDRQADRQTDTSIDGWEGGGGEGRKGKDRERHLEVARYLAESSRFELTFRSESSRCRTLRHECVATGIQTYRQTGRQADRQTDSQSDRYR